MAGPKGAPQLNPYKFKPGQSGNKNGRPKALFSKDDADRIFQACAVKTKEQLLEMLNDPKSTAVQLAVAKAWIKAVDEGRIADIDQIMNRTVGKVVEKTENKTEIETSHKEIVEGVPTEALLQLVSNDTSK